MQSSGHGTRKIVTARLWPWLAGESPENRVSCALFAQKWKGLVSHTKFFKVVLPKSIPAQIRQRILYIIKSKK